jgi:hypothetical protein
MYFLWLLFNVLIKIKFLDESQKEKITFERTWLSNFMKAFVEVLYTIPEDGAGTILILYVCIYVFF